MYLRYGTAQRENFLCVLHSHLHGGNISNDVLYIHIWLDETLYAARGDEFGPP